MRLQPTTRDVIVSLIILFGFSLFFVQLEIPRSSSLSGSVYQLGVKLGLARDRPKDESGIALGSNEYDRENQTLSTRVRWQTGGATRTAIVAHVPGWTIFDRLYVHQGTVFIVSDDPQSVPPLHEITSNGQPFGAGHQTPTDQDIQVISPEEADQRFRKTALRVEGVTFLVNESPQFIAHYYHFSAELMFGLWRAYSSLDPNITSSGQTNLPPPRRLIFPHIESKKWRDYASMNQYVIRGVFPSLVMEFEQDWKACALPPHNTLLYDQVVFADRGAALRGNMGKQIQRIAAEAMKLDASPHWWTTIRAALVKFAGYEPNQHNRIPVITYVSRQGWGRRMLRSTDHEKLVAALYDLQKKHGYEVNVVSLDKMPRAEQIKLAARTTIMMGVHGNGLTSLLWMTPTPRSTVIEFFCPPGFATDYEWTTRALGMVHYGFWNDEHFTSPKLPPRKYPECFQGNDIPIDGDSVARLVESRLSLEETDDQT